MASEQVKKFIALKKILEQEFPKEKLVSLREMVANVSKVSNVRVRTRKVEKYYELGIDDVNDEGVLTIPDEPKKFAPANESAIKSQRLHRGDLIFGYRGKMGKVGHLIDDEFDVPVVTNNGMIRIRFSDGRIDETPRYIQTYLESPLIRTFLDRMLEDRNGVKVLNVKTIEDLPIPYFEEMVGMTKFSTIVDTRKKITLAVKEVIEEAEMLLIKRKLFESESISLQIKTLDEFTIINEEDHHMKNRISQMALKLNTLEKISPSESVLLQEFEY